MALFGKKEEDPQALIKKGEYKKAIKLLQEKLKAAPRDLNILMRLAEAFEGMGDKESAARIFVEEANENLKERQREKAFALLKKAEKLLPDDEEIKNAIKAVDQKKEDDSFSFDISMDSEAAEEPPRGKDLRDIIQEALQNIFDPPKEELGDLADQCSVIRLGEGETLISEGEEGDSLYIILEGEMDVLTRIAGEDTCIKTLSGGEIVGEASFLNKVPRTATLVAKGDIMIAELKGDDARNALKGNPKLMNALEKILEKRVEDFIRQMREKG